jgi:hypothetical protein
MENDLEIKFPLWREKLNELKKNKKDLQEGGKDAVKIQENSF